MRVYGRSDQLVLETLRRGGPLTPQQIVERTSLSRSTITRLLRSLFNKGVVSRVYDCDGDALYGVAHCGGKDGLSSS